MRRNIYRTNKETTEYFKSRMKSLIAGETLIIDGGLLGVDYTLKKESEG